MRLKGRIVVIVGASSGIGWALTLGFAREGANVAALARSKEKLDRLANTIRAAGGRALPVACDISDESQVASAVKAILNEFGGIDALLITASQKVECPIAECTVADWDRLFAVNCRGTFLVCRAVLPTMRAQGHGRIVIFSSEAVKGRKPGVAIYSATKAAQISFARALSLEESDNGILVNVQLPSNTHTPMNPAGKRRPEEHLETAIWLATLPRGGPTGRVWRLMEEVRDL